MKRICLDTNIYIIGQLQQDSSEALILSALGFYNQINYCDSKVIISQEIINQILRVGKRLQGKDWASKLVDQIWQNLDCIFIPETPEFIAEGKRLLTEKLIPSEDVYIYLTAKYGKVDCFILGNRSLIKSISSFECLISETFISKYLS